MAISCTVFITWCYKENQKEFHKKFLPKSWTLYHFGASEKLLNLAIITKTPQIYYRISCTKNQSFGKTPLFYRYPEM